MNIPKILQAKMIEMQTLELQVNDRVSAQLAPEYARSSVAGMLSLLGRALVATNLEINWIDSAPLSYDPEVKLARENGGLKFPFSPPRPTQVLHTTTPAEPGTGLAAELLEHAYTGAVSEGNGWRLATGKELLDYAERSKAALRRSAERPAEASKAGDRAGTSYPWPEHLKASNLDMAQEFTAGTLSSHTHPDPWCGCDPVAEEGETVDCGPQPPEESPMIPGHDRQDLEDKLRIIAAIIDQQPAYGTEMADFKRRLQRML